MRIRFEVDGIPCEYHRDPALGRAHLRAGHETIVLQSASDLRTYFTLSLARSWELPMSGHTVRIEKRRPLFLAGIRPSHYRVLVDGGLVAERHGF